jgi:hypothetical protein
MEGKILKYIFKKWDGCAMDLSGLFRIGKCC